MDVPSCREEGDGGRQQKAGPCLEGNKEWIRDSHLPGHRGRGDIVSGNAITCILPSMDPGTMPLAEMHRNIFPLVFMMEASLFPHVLQHGIPDPWPVSSLCSQHSDRVGKKTKDVAVIRGLGSFSQLLIFLLVFLFLSYVCSGKNFYEIKGVFFSTGSHSCENCC